VSDLHVAFASNSFLRSHWDLEYRAWHDSGNEKGVDVRLALWAERTDLKETSAESAFLDVFFRETWGYVQTGQRGSETGFSRYPKFAIPRSGQTAAVAKPILRSATSARQPRARLRRCSDAEIARKERATNALIHPLYSLGAEEIEMVKKG
jgi:hypothetical protein